MSTKDTGEDTDDSNNLAVNSLATTLFGKTRRQILAVLYSRPDDRYYLRQLTSAAGVAVGAAQRELAQLTAAGIIRRDVEGRQVYFRANTACPVFAELLGILRKTGAPSRATTGDRLSGPSQVRVGDHVAATGPQVAGMPSRPAAAGAARGSRPAAPSNPAFVWMTRR